MENFSHLENIIRDKDESINSLQALIDVQKQVIASLQKIINAGFKEIEIDESQSSF
tara:strand:+ start:14039 stop:14206 length:168 start_codon:yes stop_codon:yes gene_type:complete